MSLQRDNKNGWHSCCFEIDQRCVVFSVQTTLGILLLGFCAFMLRTEENCDRAAPYWGLIGTISGFFFNQAGPLVFRKNGNELLLR